MLYNGDIRCHGNMLRYSDRCEFLRAVFYWSTYHVCHSSSTGHLRTKLDTIVNVNDFVYQNDTKYIILYDQDWLSYWILEITTTFVPFIALIFITRKFPNMDIHVSEQGHTDKWTWRNRVFFCWWILFKKTDIYISCFGRYSFYITYHWTNLLLKNQISIIVYNYNY